MKQKKLTTLAALLVAMATLTVTSSNALTSIQVQEIKTAVLSVPVPEMPAKAATLVKTARKKDRQAVAITAVRAIVAKHKAAAPLVISAIAKVAPDIAPAVAAAGAEMVPDQAITIARAASVAAPAHALEIRQTVSSAVPQGSTVASLTRSINRASAAQQTGPGTITITPTPIDSASGGGGNNQFPTQPPNEAQDPTVIYNQPPN